MGPYRWHAAVSRHRRVAASARLLSRVHPPSGSGVLSEVHCLQATPNQRQEHSLVDHPRKEAVNGEAVSLLGTGVYLLVGILVRHALTGNGHYDLPTYYKGLFHDLREALTETVARAREAQLGVWAEDQSSAGFEVDGLDSITDEHVILPKLFRRQAEYLEAGGSVGGFKELLEAKDEEIIVISTVHPTHFDTVVEVEGNTVRLTEPPENLIFEG